MKQFNTCLVKIITQSGKDSGVSLTDLLCELEQAFDQQAYEIVCLSDKDSFTIADIGHGSQFATFIQFNFASPLAESDDINAEIKSQIEGACSIDIISENDYFRLIRIEKCDISFK